MYRCGFFFFLVLRAACRHGCSPQKNGTRVLRNLALDWRSRRSISTQVSQRVMVSQSRTACVRRSWTAAPRSKNHPRMPRSTSLSNASTSASRAVALRRCATHRCRKSVGTWPCTGSRVPRCHIPPRVYELYRRNSMGASTARKIPHQCKSKF